MEWSVRRRSWRGGALACAAIHLIGGGVAAAAAEATAAPPSVAGTVTDILSGRPVAGARLILRQEPVDPAEDAGRAPAAEAGVETTPAAPAGIEVIPVAPSGATNGAGAVVVAVVTAADGSFRCAAAGPGHYALEVEADGFAPLALRGLDLVAGVDMRVDPALRPLHVASVTVRAAAGPGPGTGPSTTRLTRPEIVGRPAALLDPMRALASVPGVAAASDFHSEFRVRGGEPGETPILLDGLPVLLAHHFGGSAGSAGAINAGAVGEAVVRSGGFSAEHGGALAGVVELSTRDPRPDRLAGTMGVSSHLAHAAFSGPAGTGRYLVSARQSLLGAYDGRVGEDGIEDVGFHDTLVSLGLRPAAGTGIELDFLESGHEYAQDLGGGGRAAFDGGQRTLRARLETALDPQSLLRVSLSDGHLDVRSGATAGGSYGQDQRLRDLKISFLRLSGAGRSLLAGLERRTSGGGIAGTIDDGTGLVSAGVDAAGTTDGAFVETVWEPPGGGGGWALRTGVRVDRRSGAGAPAVSPRLAWDWSPAPGWTAHAAAGRFVQFPSAGQEFLAAGERLSRQVADHYIVGLERTSARAARLRIEMFLKRLEDPIGEADNLHVDLPERLARFDAGRVHGAEITLAGPPGEAWRWRLDYAHLVARQERDGAVHPRNADQRHAAGLSLGRGLGRGWEAAVQVRYGSGLPYSGQRLVFDGAAYRAEPGPLNAERLPAYARLDLRLARQIPVRHGRAAFHVEILNATNRANVRSETIVLDPSTSTLHRVTRFQAPLLVVAGATFDY